MNARQWSRAAWAAALLFGSVPLAGRLFLGEWAFTGAAEWACASLLVAVYLEIRARRFITKPDPATLLERAGRLAASGRTARAIAVLTAAIRTSPKLWQAYQYRGELHLREGNPSAAAEDFSAAIRLAPDELHLYVLRDHASSLRDGES
jgi:tetratricopeptide (TPR) repeat protein